MSDDDDELLKHIKKKSKKEQATAGHKDDEAFCTKCKAWYGVKKDGKLHKGH